MDYKAVIDKQISLLKKMQKETQDECKKSGPANKVNGGGLL